MPMDKMVLLHQNTLPFPFHDLQPFTVVDFPGHIACTVFTSGCNLRCPYCHNADLISPRFPPTIDEDAFFHFLKKRKGLLTGVCITGGEPTLHDLLPLLQRIKGEGFKIKLDTNGTRPERWIPWAQQGLIDYVAMDIKVPLEDYKKMGASSQDREGIRESVSYLLKNRSIPYEFRTTIHPNWLSRKDIERLGEWLKGAKKLALQPFTYSEKILDPSTCEGPGYSDEALREFQKILSPRIADVIVRGN